MLYKQSNISLKLIDKNITNKEIDLLVKWRKKVQPLWHEDFKVTYKSMQKWVKGIVNSKGRMLFFVLKDNKIIGQCGFDEANTKDCYIDAVIRGEGKSDGTMTQVVKTFITIASKFGKKIKLKVVFDNIHAIKFYKKLGFKVLKRDKKESKCLIMKYENSS